MSQRKTVLATNEIYHVYNRGVEKRPIFLTRKDYARLIDLVNYYRFKDCPFKYSHFKRILYQEKMSIMKGLEDKSKKLVEIFAFCLMPNHIHFLIKQLADNGITKFMAKVQNGFSHYFNKRHDRIGHLFQGNFGATRIEDDEQLLHVNRYIHLNPVFSCIIRVEDLEGYEYSSYPEYINKRTDGFCNIQEILSYFNNLEDYKRFITDQASHTKTLENIKHLLIEEDYNFLNSD
ncbi:MAG: hypothetical protein A3H79_04545 [Candidatus Levybacteria bacterium RIFCSPLOWO2_02_FULL_36_8b]|nr:MAG: hypothetical protein A3H79_04545 [Candidatus Levybacteria bacterium RIFCSPLOWO2_02_FULL_36_8b]